MNNGPIWKDTYYEHNFDSLNYYIKDMSNNKIIHQAYTKKMPGTTGVTLSINNKVDEYLNPEFDTDFRAEDNGVITHSDAYKTYQLRDLPVEGLLDFYNFLYDWSYEEDWTGQTGYNMSAPVKHIDPRMKAMFTIYNSGVTDYDWTIEYDAYIRLVPNHLSFTVFGGTAEVKVYSRGSWTATVNNNWISIDVNSHIGVYSADDVTTITVTVGENSDGEDRSGSVTFTGEDGQATLSINQTNAVLTITPETYTFDKDGNGSVKFVIIHTYDITMSVDNLITFDDGLWFTLSEPTTTSYGSHQRTEMTCTANGPCIGIRNYAELVVTDEKNNSVRAELRQERYKAEDNEILYKTTDGSKFTYGNWYEVINTGTGREYWYRTYSGQTLGEDAQVTANTYENGVGRLTFNDTIVYVRQLFSPIEPSYEGGNMYIGDNTRNDKLLLLVLPDSVTETGGVCHFQTHLKSIAFDGSVSEGGVMVTEQPNPGWYARGGSFAGCTALMFAELPEAEWLGGTFSGCTSLREVEVPKVHFVCDAFTDCSELKGNVPFDKLKEITDDTRTSGTFENCGKLFGDTIRFTKLEYLTDNKNTFGSCNFKEVSFNNNLVCGEYGFSGFYGCPSLVTVNIPTSVSKIAGLAFSTSGIKDINIPSNITEIKYQAFEHCTELKTVRINGNIVIGSSVFAYCSSLETVAINGQAELGNYVFQYCTNLSSVTINGQATISGSSFFNCSNLETITINGNAEFNGGYTFDRCSKLKAIYYNSTTAPTFASNSLAGVIGSNGVVHVPSNASYSIYAFTDGTHTLASKGWTLVADL